jgi:hypothetical protein
MDARWASHIQDPKQRAEFIQLVSNSTTVLNRLLDIMELGQDGITRSEFSEDDFSVPAWSERQAYRNGRRSEHQKLRDLLSFLRR